MNGRGSITLIFDELLDEMERQREKHPACDHPSVAVDATDINGGFDPFVAVGVVCMPSEASAKKRCDSATESGSLTWSHIAVEELSEAISAMNEVDRRSELIQTAAVIISWIDCIDRNKRSK